MFPRSRCEVRAMVDLLWGVGGMAGLLLIALALSSNRRAIRLRTVLGAFALQVLLGVLVLYWGPGQWALERVSTGFQAVIDTSGEGIRSEEHTSELQSRGHLVCRLLLE